MSRFPDTWLADLKAKLQDDLERVAGHYGVALDAKGKACCPFHSEKTPSFGIARGGGIFHCFGCGRSWDALAFAMDKGGLEFPDAVRELAALLGEPVPDPGSETPEQQRRRQEAAQRREQDRAALAAAQDYFAAALQVDRPEARAARDYLQGRGFPAGGGDPYGFGYAPGDGLFAWLSERDIPQAAAQRAGLVSDKGRARFWARITLPIRDRRGRVVSFAGRVLDDAKPKYLNGPTTDYFDKKATLYGIDRAAPAIRAKGYAVVVEGQLDTVRCHLHGLAHSVGLQGTAFTAEHAAQLKRLAPAVVLVADGDHAGRSATLAAVPLAHAAGLQTRVLQLPPNTDPDDYLRDTA